MQFESESTGICARSGGDAPPDFVTLDIQMPRKTGVPFYRQMKTDPKLRAIPVIVMSGLRRMNDYASSLIECFFQAERLKVPPPERYLDKPIDRAGLLDAVNAHLPAGAAQEQPA